MNEQSALQWRPLVPADAKNWSRLLAAVEATDGGWVYYTEEVLREDFADPAIDYDRGSVAVYDGESLAAYGTLASRSLASHAHEMRFEGAVHPAHRHRGIGGGLLDWAEAAAVPIHRDRRPSEALSLTATCISTNEHALTVCATHGFQQARWFHAMVRDLSEPIVDAPVPAGIQIVAFTPDRIDDARLVRNEAFLDHWGSSQLSAEDWAHFVDFAGFRPQFSYLAYADDEPIGMLISHEYDQPIETPDVRDLYIAIVGTRRRARKQGIASTLLTRAMTEAAAAGYTTSSLGVDADSETGARALYERVGFAVDHTTITHTKALIHD